MSFSQYADMAKAATKTDPPRRISHSGGPIWRIPLSMDDHTKRDARKFRGNLRNQAITLIDPSPKPSGHCKFWSTRATRSQKPLAQCTNLKIPPRFTDACACKLACTPTHVETGPE